MFVSHTKDESTSALRMLSENGCDEIIRFNEMIPIFHKIRALKEKSFATLVSGRSPFGLNTNHHGTAEKTSGSVPYYERIGYTYISKERITRNQQLVGSYKIYISKAYGANNSFPHQIINKPIFGDAGTICSGTYLLVGPFSSKIETQNAVSYMTTRFFRFMVAMLKVSQDASYKVYKLVPMQDFTEPWSDEKLYAKYGLTQEEIAFIESMIRPMELGGSSDE